MSASCVVYLPDYASGKSKNLKYLHKAGIKGISSYRMDFTDERVLTTQSAYVPLKDHNGIHMSRLVDIIRELEGEPIEMDDSILELLASSHDTTNSYWDCAWESLHSTDDNQSLRISCRLEGVKRDKDVKWYVTLAVPYASVCPCSHEMVKARGHGIPHMQRATARVTGLLNPQEDLSIAIGTAVSKICNAVVLVPLPHMKRKDELAWCERAADTNLFVEDAAREVAKAIDNWFNDWVVVCEHEESIHQHNVVAVCRKGDELL